MNRKHSQNVYHGNLNVISIEKKCISDQWWNNDKCQCKC